MLGRSSETREGVGIVVKVVEAHNEDILGELGDVIRCVRAILRLGRGRVDVGAASGRRTVKLAEVVKLSIETDRRGGWGDGRAHLVCPGGGRGRPHAVRHELVLADRRLGAGWMILKKHAPRV